MLFKLDETIKVNGEGNTLFAVVTVDREDCEDTTTELWLANDEYHLEEQVMLEFLGVDTIEEAEDHEMKFQFDEDWGFSIIPTKIGSLT